MRIGSRVRATDDEAKDDPMNRRLRFLTVLLFLSVIVVSACSDSDVMPDILGMNKDDSAEAMSDAGIDDWTVEWREGDEPLKVIYQSPDPGTPIEYEMEIKITLSGRE